MRVIRRGSIKIHEEAGGTGTGTIGSGLRNDGPYRMSPWDNELVVVGCNMVATVEEEHTNSTKSACAFFCSDSTYYSQNERRDPGGKVCSGMGCCQTDIPFLMHTNLNVRFRWFGWNRTGEDMWETPRVFIAEVGWFDMPWVSNELYWLTGGRGQGLGY